jgi:flavin reductase (DIM6/NTAB) family NADH-FMN oxidoreductase RutF
MFYDSSALPKGLFKACIVPRPIAWVSSVSKKGVFNLAPFSYFNAISDQPPMIMFSTTNAHIEGGAKDSLENIEETGEFVVNIATYDMREAINLSSAELPREQDEFEFSLVEHEPSELVKVPRVKKSPVHLECLYHTSVQLPTDSTENINRMVIGRVLGIHINPQVMTDGRIDISKLEPIARLGYNDYAKITHDIFTLIRPK